MSKFFTFSRNQGVILVTLLFVLLLGGIYFFMYIPNNQRNLEEQRFRCLQNIENNIHEKIDNSVALLNNLLITYENNDKQYDTTRLKEYIKNYPQQNFTLLPVTKPKDSTKKAIATAPVSLILINKSLLSTLKKETIKLD
jgi:predicted PurR-regulated permease PerM